MIISRKVAVSAIMSGLALILVWAADHYLHITLDPVQAMGALLFVATSAGWITREDARVANYLKLKGRHRPTVGELVEQQDADREDGLYETESLPAVHR